MQLKVSIENQSPQNTRLRFISTCTCLYVKPETLTLKSGDTGTMRLTYDPFEDSGDVEMVVIIKKEIQEGKERYFFRIYGHVVPSQLPEAGEETNNKVIVEDTPIWFTYYYDPGCKGCTLFLVRLMYSLQSELGIKLRVFEKDIRNQEMYNEYIKKLVEMKARS